MRRTDVLGSYDRSVPNGEVARGKSGTINFWDGENGEGGVMAGNGYLGKSIAPDTLNRIFFEVRRESLPLVLPTVLIIRGSLLL